ncbi:MAG: hypothetical protein PHD43_08940 [Methylococcales bacterium]|nr:hypothetical protein [Methylococcales bacterium]
MSSRLIHNKDLSINESQGILAILEKYSHALTVYGFQAKTIDEKDAQGEVIGKKVVYGFAKYLRDACLMPLIWVLPARQLKKRMSTRRHIKLFSKYLYALYSMGFGWQRSFKKTP